MSENRAIAPHVGLTVPDIDQAISWYTETLGFRLLAGPLEVKEDGSALGDVGVEIYGAGYQRWRFAHLATDDNVGLELFQFDSPVTSLGKTISNTGSAASITSASPFPTSRASSPRSSQRAARPAPRLHREP